MLTKLRDFIRPISVAAMLFILLLGAVVSGVLEAFMPGIGTRFTVGVAGWFRAIPTEYYSLIGAAMLGYTAARTIEKSMKVRQEAQPDEEMV